MPMATSDVPVPCPRPMPATDVAQGADASTFHLSFRSVARSR
jgi:hypothetical protein